MRFLQMGHCVFLLRSMWCTRQRLQNEWPAGGTECGELAMVVCNGDIAVTMQGRSRWEKAAKDTAQDQRSSLKEHDQDACSAGCCEAPDDLTWPLTTTVRACSSRHPPTTVIHNPLTAGEQHHGRVVGRHHELVAHGAGVLALQLVHQEGVQRVLLRRQRLGLALPGGGGPGGEAGCGQGRCGSGRCSR